MTRQLSTALSELLLFAFCCVMIQQVYGRNLLLSIALGTTCIASFFGILKYGLTESRSDVYRWHRLFTKVAFVFSPAMYASVYVSGVHTMGSLVFFVAPIIITFVMSEIAPESQEVFMTLLSGAAIIAIAYVSFVQNIISGIIGASLLVLSSLLAQTEGRLQGIKRVDLFHVTLIPALYFLTNGVLKN